MWWYLLFVLKEVGRCCLLASMDVFVRAEAGFVEDWNSAELAAFSCCLRETDWSRGVGVAERDRRISVGVDSRLDESEFFSIRPIFEVSVFTRDWPMTGWGDRDDDWWPTDEDFTYI